MSPCIYFTFTVIEATENFPAVAEDAEKILSETTFKEVAAFALKVSLTGTTRDKEKCICVA